MPSAIWHPLHQQLYDERVAALTDFQTEVSAKKFPYAPQTITMHPNEEVKLLEALDKVS